MGYLILIFNYAKFSIRFFRQIYSFPSRAGEFGVQFSFTVIMARVQHQFAREYFLIKHLKVRHPAQLLIDFSSSAGKI